MTYSLIDTNIFVYAKFRDSPFHELSKEFIDRVSHSSGGYCIFQQILTEYYRFVVRYTNIQEARESINQVLFLKGLTLLPCPPNLTSIWCNLIEEHAIEGKRVFDLQLVAAMRGSGINKIYAKSLNMTSETANYDETWKEALTEYFEAFLHFFFPEVHQLIDWQKPTQSLEKELKRITASAKTQKRFADKLYQVWLLEGQEAWILIHVEIQSQYETDFPQRMYIYNYRAFDLYQKPVISLAILGDDRFNWRPACYNYTIAGCEVSLKFPTVKLLDYEERWSELEASTNPFAIIVMAHLKTKATTGKLQQREQWKWRLIRGLYDRGFERNQIIKLFEIIDNMMTLSTELQQSLESKIKQFEEEKTMPLVSNMELRGRKIGEEIGKEIGALQNARDFVKTVLKARVGEISLDIEQYLNEVSVLSKLEEIVKLAATANSLEEFKQSLAKIS
jgi:predicted nucleic acid-binding protein